MTCKFPYSIYGKGLAQESTMNTIKQHMGNSIRKTIALSNLLLDPWFHEIFTHASPITIADTTIQIT